MKWTDKVPETFAAAAVPSDGCPSPSGVAVAVTSGAEDGEPVPAVQPARTSNPTTTRTERG
jgi:hypothetical protein